MGGEQQFYVARTAVARVASAQIADMEAEILLNLLAHNCIVYRRFTGRNLGSIVKFVVGCIYDWGEDWAWHKEDNARTATIAKT